VNLNTLFMKMLNFFDFYCRSITLTIGALMLSGCLQTTTQLTNASGRPVPVDVSVLVADQTKPRPTVLIAHGSDGLQPYYRELATQVAGWGYNAVLIDHYSRRGIGIHTGRIVEGARGFERARDMLDAARWVRSQHWHSGGIGVIGVSQGGAGVFALVNSLMMDAMDVHPRSERLPFSAAVALYPGCLITPPPTIPTIPTMMHLAEDDDLARIVHCVPRNDPSYTVHVYPGVTHSFDNALIAGLRLSFTHRYDPAATALSRQRTREFLSQHLKDR